jgi:hypothetical protein
MMNYSKLASGMALAIALSGCFEVEDNNNNADVVAALEAQNAILQQQVTVVEKTPITLFGSVVDAGTQEPVSEATILVKVGSEWRPAETVTGEFTIEQLPVNTDVVVVVQSPTSAFMDRTFYGKTTQAQQGQVAMQSMGDLLVSEGVVKTYSILDSDTSEPFKGIEFSYNTATSFSSSGPVSGLNNYAVKSTFNEATGEYSIVLPESLNFSVTASRDIDGDGILDFTPLESSFSHGDKLYLSAFEAMQLVTMYVDETEAYQPVELRITLINELGENIEGAEFFASDTFHGRMETSYDTDTFEYVFNYHTSSRVDLNMPSFTNSEEISYQSGTIVLTWASENSLYVSDYGFRNNLSGEIAVAEGVASVIVQPYVASTASDYVSKVSSVIDEASNYSLKQFYQSQIGLLAESVTLTRNNVFTVIKGNDSATDVVPEGTTKVGYLSVPVSVTTSLSHNNTFLTATPSATLEAGSYQYRVDELINAQTGNTFDSNWYTNFSVASTTIDHGVFNINDVKFDNNNGTTIGTQIVATSTAGIANTAINDSRNTYLYFPKAILSLDFFEMNLVSYVRNGTTYTNIREINIVDGENVFVGTRNLVSLAENENIENIAGGYSANIDSQTSLVDGQWYKSNSYIGIYSSDNTASSVNTATFTYIYRVRGEESVVEGTITLPVL